MTKKDYLLIARAIGYIESIRSFNNDGRYTELRALNEANEAVAGVIEALADALAADNPEFDRADFIANCNGFGVDSACDL